MADLLSLNQYVQQGFQQGRERKNKATLAKLYSSALAAPEDQQGGYVQQMAAVDPGAAMQAQSQFGDMRKQAHDELGRDVALFVATAESADPATVQQSYAQLVQKARAMGHPVPPTYDPRMLPMLQKYASVVTGGAGGATGVQSTYIDAQGNRVAIMRDGRSQVIGQNAPNNQIIDTGNGFYGVNKGNLSAAPVVVGAPQQQAPQAPGEVPFSIDPSLPPEVQASIRANPQAGSAEGITAPITAGPQGQQLRSAPKPPPEITPYQQAELGLRQQQMTVAQQARADAAAAKKAAQDAATEQKSQAAKARQAAAAEASNQLVDSIDGLMKSPGFNKLGTIKGDFEINTPLIRSDAKDASEQLHNIAGQVALATMSRLKALSSQGATGFGSLSGPELHLLQNSISALSADKISNAQLRSSLKIIRDTMAKVSNWNPQQSQGAAPSGNVDDLLSKYGVK